MLIYIIVSFVLLSVIVVFFSANKIFNLFALTMFFLVAIFGILQIQGSAQIMAQVAAGYGADKAAYCVIANGVPSGSERLSDFTVTGDANNLVSSGIMWTGSNGTQRAFLWKSTSIKNITYQSYAIFLGLNSSPPKYVLNKIDEFLAPFNLKESDCKILSED